MKDMMLFMHYIYNKFHSVPDKEIEYGFSSPTRDDLKNAFFEISL